MISHRSSARRAGIIAAALFALPLAAGPALAQEKTPEQLAAEGLGKIISALELFIDNIPQYEMPEVLPNGDIIIRRKQPGETSPEKTPENGDGPVEIERDPNSI